MDVQIPDKLYFKIGEVAEITGVKPHVLRYWESEFAPFRPIKSKNQQRLYRSKDIELVLQLKDLLYRQGFTIAGARKRISEKRSSSPPCTIPPSGAGSDRRLLEEVRSDLRRLRDSLDARSR